MVTRQPGITPKYGHSYLHTRVNQNHHNHPYSRAVRRMSVSRRLEPRRRGLTPNPLTPDTAAATAGITTATATAAISPLPPTEPHPPPARHRSQFTSLATAPFPRRRPRRRLTPPPSRPSPPPPPPASPPPSSLPPPPPPTRVPVPPHHHHPADATAVTAPAAVHSAPGFPPQIIFAVGTRGLSCVPIIQLRPPRHHHHHHHHHHHLLHRFLRSLPRSRSRCDNLKQLTPPISHCN